MTDVVANPASVFLWPDAGPLITLAYGQALDLLLKPSWSVRIVDMVLHEVTRNATPSSEAIRCWIQVNRVPVMTTRTYRHFRAADWREGGQVRKANLGELAVQEAMHEMALNESEHISVFLFEDHKIARASFFVPDNCRKISTRAYLQFLEGKGWIDSAAEVERAVIAQGRNFSQLRFPP
jgi:hypothetical protein